MTRFLIAVGGFAILLGNPSAEAAAWAPSPGHVELPLWPGTPPDAQAQPGPEAVEVGDGLIAGRRVTGVKNVSRPTLAVYAASGKNTGAAVVVFPGGGYKGLAIDLEGTEVCDWLVPRGITCAVLKYRVPDSGPHWERSCDCQVKPKAPTALEDAQRALGLIRLHAAEWHLDPHKVGVLGFSAGGHLVAAISTHFEHRAYVAVDAADALSCRPDFAVALYPGHLYLQDEKRFALDPDFPVTGDTPPTFLLQAENDPIDTINHSLVYYIALKDKGVPVEMHLFAEGGHAFGIRPTKFPITAWPGLVETWLRTIGVTRGE